MREKYESLSAVVLKDLAKARGLKNISNMKKSDLIELMLAEDERQARERGEQAQTNESGSTRGSGRERTGTRESGRERTSARESIKENSARENAKESSREGMSARENGRESAGTRERVRETTKLRGGGKGQYRAGRDAYES